MYAKRVKQTKALFRTTRGHTATEFHWFAIWMCPDSMFLLKIYSCQFVLY